MTNRFSLPLCVRQWLLAIGLFGFSLSASATNWVITDLGTMGPPFMDYSRATGINASGQIVGTFTTDDFVYHPFLYSNGTARDLGTLGGETGVATGINASGQVVGYSATIDGFTRAFLYSNGTMQALGTLGGDYSSANAINDSGQIVGCSTTTSAGACHAFLYANGTMQDLGTLGGDFSSAFGINAAGHVVGYSTTADGLQHAFLYANGTMQDLGTLGGDLSIAYAINDSDQVVGTSYLSDGLTFRPFLWSNGTMQDLGAPLGYNTGAAGINNSGQVVGSGRVEGGEVSLAFLYSDGVMTNLAQVPEVKAAGWTILRGAGAINGSGQIVGTGTHGQARFYLLTPVADTVAPTTTASAAPAPNTAGWNNASVNVTLAAADNPGGAGVKSISYTVANGSSTASNTVNAASVSLPVSAEGANIVTYSAVDNAGNVEAQKTLTVRIDGIAPVSTATAAPAPNANGWNNAPVTVGLSAADSGSGVKSIVYSVSTVSPSGTVLAGGTVTGAAGSFVVSSQGISTVTYHASDAAGNVEGDKILTLRIDATPPVLKLPANITANTASSAGTAVSYTVSATDNLTTMPSVTCAPASGSVFPVGTTTVSCTARDAAGNASSGSFSVTVRKRRF